MDLLQGQLTFSDTKVAVFSTEMFQCLFFLCSKCIVFLFLRFVEEFHQENILLWSIYLRLFFGIFLSSGTRKTCLSWLIEICCTHIHLSRKISTLPDLLAQFLKKNLLFFMIKFIICNLVFDDIGSNFFW